MDELFYNIRGKNKEKLLLFLEANTVFYAKNTTILTKNFSDNIICIIVQGSIQVKKTDANGNQVILQVFEKNDIFGTLLNGYNNSDYQIKTTENSKILIIDFDNIKNLKNLTVYVNQFYKNFLDLLCNKIKQNNQRIEILSSKTIRVKLLTYFKYLSKQTNSKVIYLPFSLTSLADYLSIDRSAMSRELKILKEDNLIEVKGRRIKLLYSI